MQAQDHNCRLRTTCALSPMSLAATEHLMLWSALLTKPRHPDVHGLEA